MAARIHVGSREQGSIELEGEIVAVTDTGFTIDIRGGGTTDIIVDDDTSVSGDIVEGAFVEIEGQLNSEFAVLAFEVVDDVDGDADDDNKRGKRGHGNSNNNGHGNGDDDDDDDDDDDSDGDDDGSDDGDSITVGAEISLAAEDSDLHG